MMSASPTEIVLHVPRLWRSAFAPVVEVSKQQKLPVRLSSSSDSDIEGDIPQALLKKLASADPALHLVVMPLGQFVLTNRKHGDHGLKVLGPAVKTKNDIFVFRNLALGHKVPVRLGVRSLRLTTTCVARVIWAGWSPERYFGPAAAEADWRKTQPPLWSGLDWSERLQALRDGTIGAALFTGSEIDRVRRLNDANLLPVANLNRVINSFYNVRHLTRAVFVLSEAQLDPIRRELLAVFAGIYNSRLRAMSHDRNKHEATGAAIERREQLLCRTWTDADPDDLSVLLQFGSHIHRFGGVEPASQWSRECFLDWPKIWNLNQLVSGQLEKRLRSVSPSEFGIACTEDSATSLTQGLRVAADGLHEKARVDPDVVDSMEVKQVVEAALQGTGLSLNCTNHVIRWVEKEWTRLKSSVEL